MEACARNNQKRKRKRKGVGRKDTFRLLSPSKGTKEGKRDKRKVTLGHFYGINDVIPVPSSRRVIQPDRTDLLVVPVWTTHFLPLIFFIFVVAIRAPRCVWLLGWGL